MSGKDKGVEARYGVSIYLTWFLVPLLSLLYCDRRIYVAAVAVNYIMSGIATCLISPYFVNVMSNFNTPTEMSLRDKEPADCLASSIGSRGKSYRTGGDEFLAIVHTDEPEKIICDIHQKAANWHGMYLDKISMSVGFAALKDHQGGDDR